MIGTRTLLLFSAAVLTLMVSPGPNLAFTLTCGISHGARGGLAAAAGIFLSDLLLTALTTLGVTAAILAWPPSFDLLRWFGALYLVWLAVQALRRRGPASLEGKDRATLAQILRMALLNSLLNPKALLFFLVFLPQFVTPGHGSVQLQLATLGVALSLIALAFHAGVGVTSGKTASWLRRSAWPGSGLRWIHAGLFLALAARLVLLARPASG